MTEIVFEFALVFRANGHFCALPLQHVIETLRPLPITPLAGAPHYVLGLSVIRGLPVPVVDAARLLGAAKSAPSRLISVVTGERRIALAVDSVLGVRRLDPQSQHIVPPLLLEAGDGVVESLGLLDAELMLVLESARLLPPQIAAAMVDAP